MFCCLIEISLSSTVLILGHYRFLYNPQCPLAIRTVKNSSLETGVCSNQRGYASSVSFGNE